MERQITLGDVIAPAKVLRCDNDDYPVLSMTMHDGIVLQSDRFKKSLASIDQSNYKVVLRGQLVVGFPIDEGVIYVQNITEAGIMSPAYGVWNIHSKEIMPEYLELCLHSPQSMDYYKNKLRGTTARRRSITTGDLLALPITLPSLTEQKRRIGLLQQATLLLNSQKQAMLKFDELVKSRFVEMFGEPEFNNKQLEIKPLGELCNVGSSKRIYQSEQTQEGIPFLRISDLVYKMDTGNDSCDLYIPVARYDELAQQGLVPVEGDILLTARGTLGRCYIVQADDRFYFQDGMISWLSRYAPTITPIYIAYLFQMKGFRKQIDEMQAGSTVAYLSIDMTKKLKVMLPPLELQNRFAAFVAEVDKSKLSYEMEVAA